MKQTNSGIIVLQYPELQYDGEQHIRYTEHGKSTTFTFTVATNNRTPKEILLVAAKDIIKKI